MFYTGYEVIKEIKDSLEGGDMITKIKKDGVSIDVQSFSMFKEEVDERGSTTETIYVAIDPSKAQQLEKLKNNGLLHKNNNSNLIYQNSDVRIDIDVRKQYFFERKEDQITINQIIGRPSTTSPDIKQEIREEVSKGYSYSDVAKKFNISKSSVYRYVGKE